MERIPTPRASIGSAPGWRRRPLITVSGALHIAAAAGLAIRPSAWPWSLGIVVANHALLTAVGLWPRSNSLGPNRSRLPDSAAGCVAITIDDGPDPEVTPQVLEILARANARATFFCVGERVAENSSLTREIAAAGHRIENHTHRHLNRFSLLGPRGMRAEIERAQESIRDVTGQSPRFFRAPAGLRNPFLDPILESLSLELVSWTRRGFDTVADAPDTVLTRLTRALAARDILLLHDGHAARTSTGTAVVVEVLPRLLAEVRGAGLRIVTLHEAIPA